MLKNKITVLGLLAAMSFFMLSCGSLPKDMYPDVKLTECSNPKPQICTREYRPVCGFEADGNHKTFSNACTACSNANINSYSEGDCNKLQSLSK